MSQSRKDNIAQEAPGARRGRSAPAGEDALWHGSHAFARAGFSDASLVLRWREIAGPEVARVAQPVKLQEGPEGAVLTLRCAPGSAVLLQHETRALMQRINAYAGRGRIARLRLVTGETVQLPEPPRHPSRGMTEPGDSPESGDLDGALERLGRRRLATRKVPGKAH